MDHITMCICHDLEFDMPRARDEFFQINISISKSGFSLASRGMEKGRHFLQAFYLSHAFSAAARCGFDEQWESDLWGFCEQLLVGHVAHIFSARHNRYTRLDNSCACFGLITHRRNGRWFWSDESDASLDTGCSKIIALCEKTISRVDRIHV